jgi:alpha-tubulin suppressor-like RCC1 family protein
VGEVGDGTLTERGVMVPVTGLPPVNEIAASLIDSVATTADHQVWGWGWNAVGTLGDGTTVDRHSPVPTAGPLAATAIAAGVYHTLALGL